VAGDRDTGRALVENDIPSMVSVTGSVRAGIEVARSAAPTLKKVHLELGGKAPVIVFDDADVESTAAGIAGAGFFNAGQDCTAATRVLAGRRSTPTSSTLWSSRPGPRRSAAPTSKTPTSPPQQREPAGPRLGLLRPGPVPRARPRRWLPGR